MVNSLRPTASAHVDMGPAMRVVIFHLRLRLTRGRLALSYRMNMASAVGAGVMMSQRRWEEEEDSFRPPVRLFLCPFLRFIFSLRR